ncbi:MAG: UvrB/UvrC motif-containing protein [Pirellulales bacterium]
MEKIPEDNSQAAEKVRHFPRTPGVYLMKDAASRVLYVGKAKDLRSRAGSYFLKAAAEDPRTARLVREVRDVDYLEAETEIDALLLEARLIKDIQPPLNRDLRDDKSFPYLEITTREPYPRVAFTRQPRGKGTKLFGPFANPRALRGAIQVLQRIFKFRTCTLDIDPEDRRWQWFRPCLLASISQCTAPCNLRISREEYRKDIRRLVRFLEGHRKGLLEELRREMKQAADQRRFEDAARLRDEIQMIEALDDRGALETHVQPEVFPIDPKRGLAGLRQVLGLEKAPRTIEGIDVAHTGGTDTVAGVVQFIDGLPFKPGYKRLKIRGSVGPDDTGSLREAVFRRFERLSRVDDDAPPELLLIDGGRGQLGAALAALDSLRTERPRIVSLAKREELLFTPERSEPIRLGRHSYSLRLLQYVRDEAHRFAQHYHHLLRSRSQVG